MSFKSFNNQQTRKTLRNVMFTSLLDFVTVLVPEISGGVCPPVLQEVYRDSAKPAPPDKTMFAKFRVI